MARVWDEELEATGYTETWDGGEDVGGGNVLDEDFAVSSVTGSTALWDTLCLKSSNDGTGSAAALVEHAGFSLNDSWARYEINYPVVPSSGQTIIEAYDVGSSLILYQLTLLNSGVLRLIAYHDGTSNNHDSLAALSVDTEYRVEVKWDSGNNVYAWRIGDVDQPNNVDSSDPISSEGTLTSTHATTLERLRVGLQVSNRNTLVYFDNIAIDDADWVGAEPSGISATLTPGSFLVTGVAIATSIFVPSDVIRAKVEMEFTGQGNGWTDVTPDTDLRSGMDGSRGIHGQSPRDRVSTTGVVNLALINSAANSGALQGYYTTGHANQRAGFATGIGLRVSVVIGATTVPLWTGTIAKIRPTPGSFGPQQLTFITGYDYMDMLARHRLTGLSTAEDLTEHALFDLIIDEMPIPPLARETQTGFDTYPFAFDTTREETAVPLRELQRLAQSSLAVVWPRGDGTLVYEIRSIRASPAAASIAIGEGDLLNRAPPDIDDFSLDLVNRVQTIISPRRTEAANVVLFEISAPQPFEPGGPFLVRGLYSDPAQRAIRAGGIDLVTAVSGTDFIFNTQADGGGSNITSDFDVSTTFSANAVLFGVTNNGSVTGYATTLQARGIGVYAVERIMLEDSDTASINQIGENAFSLEMPYQADVTTAREVAQYLLHILSQEDKKIRAVPLWLDGADEARALLIAQREISDVFTFTESVTALSGAKFHINAIDFRLEPDGTFWFYWTPVTADSTAFWFLEQVGFSELDQTTRLGFGYVVGHTDVVHADSHIDLAHADTAHVDTHTDDAHGDDAHGDAGHADVTHVDTAFVDTHTDVPHDDVAHSDAVHADSHSDVTHIDVAHVDTAHVDSHTDDPHGDMAHSDSPSHTDGETVDEHGDEVHADTAHGDSHTDTAHGDSHTDTAHADSHNDTAHGDSHGDTAHTDEHTDTAHGDSHTDTAHTDSGHVDTAHGDSYTDTAHADTAHGDSHGDVAHGDANLILLLVFVGYILEAGGLL